MEAKTSQGADADADRVRALAAYQDFLTIWQAADRDAPILKEAKAEYAKTVWRACIGALWTGFLCHETSALTAGLARVYSPTGATRSVVCLFYRLKPSGKPAPQEVHGWRTTRLLMSGGRITVKKTRSGES
jgi:hypothetical protein